MALVVESGRYEGHPIRKARKDRLCEFSDKRGVYNRGLGHKIPAGSYYVEGERTMEVANGFGHEIYCLDCVPEAKAQMAAKLQEAA